MEDVATPEAFARDPETVQRFYNDRRAQLLSDAAPNPAHTGLAKFESTHTGSFVIVTQNVDDLHERAGSKNVLHMHGELLKARCLHCGTVSDCRSELSQHTPCPHCGQPNGMRPDIVWFGEIPKHMTIIEQALAQCDLFVAIGTSGNVYPAAGFVQVAYHANAHTVELNLEATPNQHFAQKIEGAATETVNTFFSAN